MQTVKSIVKAPMTENAGDVAKGAVYILTAFIVFSLKAIGHVINTIYKMVKWLITHDARAVSVK